MTPPKELAERTDRTASGAAALGDQALIHHALPQPSAAKIELSTEDDVLSKLNAPLLQDTANQAAGQLKPIHRGIHDPLGSSQVTQNAKQLRYLTNEHFVDRINYDCAVGPHVEWSIAGGTILGKSLVKGWILGKAGESLGPAARLGGIGAGVAIGAVTGIYTAYHTSELLENSCRAKAFEERLNQTKGGTQTDNTSVLDPLTHTYDIERGFPSVRTVVDSSRERIDSLLGLKRHDESAMNFQKAMAHSKLDDASYIAWAHKESAVPLGKRIGHDATFVTMGIAGGLFAAKKLHLGLKGSLVLAAAGAAAGEGLSLLGVSAQENTTLADLLKDRLMSKPQDRPRP